MLILLIVLYWLIRFKQSRTCDHRLGGSKVIKHLVDNNRNVNMKSNNQNIDSTRIVITLSVPLYSLLYSTAIPLWFTLYQQIALKEENTWRNIHRGPATSLDVHPFTREIVTAGEDGVINLITLTDTKPKKRIGNLSPSINHLHLSILVHIYPSIHS